MSETFYSERFGKNLWLTNHAIESMAKRNLTLAEVKRLIEEGEYRTKEACMAGSSTSSSLGATTSSVLR